MKVYSWLSPALITQHSSSYKIHATAGALLKQQHIPAVGLQVKMLNALQTEPYWKAINVNRLEEVRLALRDLMTYLIAERQEHIQTNFADTLDHDGITDFDIIPNYSPLKNYKDRVESYVREHKDHLVIQKLKKNKPITQKDIQTLEGILFDGETVGTQQDYTDNFSDKPLGEFIRGIVGLETSAAQEAFADFIHAGNLRADQMTFMNTIITYLTKNGVIEKKMLFEAPFTDLHHEGLFGLFDNADAGKVIRLIDEVNGNAVAMTG